MLDVPLEMVQQDDADTFPVQMSADTQRRKALECEMQVRTCYLCFFPPLCQREQRIQHTFLCSTPCSEGIRDPARARGAEQQSRTWLGAAAGEVGV